MGDTQFFQDTTATVITLDGPAGAGKGAIGSFLANTLGFHLLDSGAIYRAVALGVMRYGVSDPSDEFATEVAIEVVNGLTFAPNGGAFMNGHCLGNQIRSEEVSKFTPRIARIRSLRLAIRQFQLSMRKAPGLVADGRDMGEIFRAPNCYGIFVTAKAEVRAMRRLCDKRANPKGLLVYEEVLRSILMRDEEDQRREDGKLQVHEGSAVLDTSYLRMNEMCYEALRLYCHMEQHSK